MVDKTIKELAEELGVSKQTVQYHYRFLPTKESTKENRGIIYLNPLEQTFIANRIGKKNDKETPKKSAKETGNYTPKNEWIEFLKKELYEVKSDYQKQLHAKDEQLTMIQKLLDQQQQLTLQSNKRINQLESQINLLQSPEKEEPQKKWWQFRRKKSD